MIAEIHTYEEHCKFFHTTCLPSDLQGHLTLPQRRHSVKSKNSMLVTVVISLMANLFVRI